jgi:hypothetical protein
MRNRGKWLGAILTAGLMVSAHAAPQKAVFASDVSTVQWPIADLDPAIPVEWKDFEFLVVEFRSSSSQRFELGLVGESGSISKRIHPLANVWVRASIPLAFYRQGLGDADELASTMPTSWPPLSTSRATVTGSTSRPADTVPSNACGPSA